MLKYSTTRCGSSSSLCCHEGEEVADHRDVATANLSPLALLFAINALLFFLGCILEGITILIVLTPVLLPVVVAAGIDPVYFGVLMVYNINIGLITPPMGLLLYVVCDLSKEKFEHVCKDIVVFYIPMMIMLVLMIFFPPIITWLPDYVFGK
jgi:C4-dicarboxylate transporter, DctM subunit